MRVDRHNLGALVFFVTLLIAPEIPLGSTEGGPARQTLSLASFGVATWMLLSFTHLSYPLSTRVVPTEVFCVFAVYSLVISSLSLRMGTVFGAVQYLYYALALGLLMPAYLYYRARQHRLPEFFSILGFVGAIYVLGILFSIWYGPIYPDQVGTAAKRYNDLVISRAAGFSSGVNQAGGVAAVITAFYLFVYRQQSRWGTTLAGLAAIALVATLSRSAMLSFILALGAWAALVGVRSLVYGRLPRQSVRMIVVLLTVISATVCLGAGFALVSAQAADLLKQTVYGLGVDPTVGADHVGQRLAHWRKGIAAWTEKPLSAFVFGTGFRTSSIISNRSGAYVSSHNSYVEILNDFGIVGLLLLGASILVALGRLAKKIVSAQDSPLANFCFVSLLTLASHCMTEVFLYSIIIQSLLILILATTALETMPSRRSRPEAARVGGRGVRLAAG